MQPAEFHRAKLDRAVRVYWVTLGYLVSILALGGLVEALGLA